MHTLAVQAATSSSDNSTPMHVTVAVSDCHSPPQHPPTTGTDAKGGSGGAVPPPPTASRVRRVLSAVHSAVLLGAIVLAVHFTQQPSFNEAVRRLPLLRELGAGPVRIPHASSDVQYTGRMKVTADYRGFDFPGCAVKVKVTGTTSLTAVMQERIGNRYQVRVNGELHKRMETHANTDEFVLVRDLDRRLPYTIELIKVSEAALENGRSSQQNWVKFFGFAGDSTVEALPLPAKPTTRVEFIGDSITAGAGTLIGRSGFSCGGLATVRAFRVDCVC